MAETILIGTSSASRYVGTRAPSGMTQCGGIFNWALLKGEPLLIGTTS